MTRTLQIVVEEDGDDGDGSADESGVVSLDREAVARVVTPTNLQLLDAIVAHEPGSIRATAEAAGRDVKNVHENLMELSRLGVVEFEWEGRSRRPVVPYDQLQVTVSLAGEES